MSIYSNMLGPTRAPAGTHNGQTPQTQPLPGRAEDMHRDPSGGMVFTLDDWTQLRRFLILGTAEGTYYATKEAHSNAGMALVDRCIQADPKRIVDEIVAISEAGAPLKQSPCIFALARACSRKTGNHEWDTRDNHPVTAGRIYALAHAPRVLRTFQHVFEFMDYVRRQRGGGKGLTRMLSRLVLDRKTDDVEYQALKYRNREGWTPKDLLRYAHPRPETEDVARRGLFEWITTPNSEQARAAVAASPRLAAFEKLQDMGTVQSDSDRKTAVELITTNRFTHEFVPNTLLNDRDVWRALLPNLPLTALIRNLRKMTQVGLLVDGDPSVDVLRERLVNNEALRRARVHPLRLMMAERQYRSGASRFNHGEAFVPSAYVLSALEDALDLSWTAVEPLNKRVLMCVDDSGSMNAPATSDGMSAFEAALAMAVWYKRTERNCTLVTFTQSVANVKLINVSNKATVNELRATIPRTGNGTDCASPILWALDKLKVMPEVVVEITDNASWAGHTHVAEALTRTRRKAGHPVAAIVAATTATASSVLDPKDPHALNVVGFDPTVPEAIAAHVNEVFRSN